VKIVYNYLKNGEAFIKLNTSFICCNKTWKKFYMSLEAESEAVESIAVQILHNRESCEYNRFSNQQPWFQSINSISHK